MSRTRSIKPEATEPATRTASGYAYALPASTANDLAAAPLPAGVRLAFVAESPAAARALEAWVLGPIEPAGRVVPLQQGEAASGEGIDPAAYALGARARALLRGLRIAEADLEEAGGAFDAETVRGLLNGISRQALEKRVREGSLLAVPGPSNRRRYPAAQFTRNGPVPGLREVRAALQTENPWAVLNFLVRPDPRLGGRKPVELLEEGAVDQVAAAARGVGLQGG